MICVASGPTIPLDGLWHPIAAIENFAVPPGWSVETDGPMIRAVRNELSY